MSRTAFLVNRKGRDEYVWTLPNFITITGILSLLIYAAQIVTNAAIILAPVMLFIGVASDLLDGEIARRKKMATSLGRFLDNTRDKLVLVVIVLSAIYLWEQFLLVYVWVGIESIVFIKELIDGFRESAQAHKINKISLAIIMLCGGILITEKAWLTFSILPLNLLLWVIVLAAIARLWSSFNAISN